MRAAKCLGRYWEVGPQQTLYVPAEWLRAGPNEVVVLIKPTQHVLVGLDHPILEVLTAPKPAAVN